MLLLQVKFFFTMYSINRHKMTTLTPSYHAEVSHIIISKIFKYVFFYLIFYKRSIATNLNWDPDPGF